MISETAAKRWSGSYLGVKLDDIMHPKQEDERIGEEIAMELFDRMGIEVIQKGGESE